MTHLGGRHSGTRPPIDVELRSTLDLKDDPRAAMTIQVAFTASVVAMVLLAVLVDLPFESSRSTFVSIALTLLACVAYMVVHELTHALVLWVLTRERPHIAVRLPYLVTGSPALLTRRIALVVALTPFVVLTLALVGLLATLPPSFFLMAYVVLALNVAGSAGDVLQAWHFLRLPRIALVRDDGRETSVFLPKGPTSPPMSGRDPTGERTQQRTRSAEERVLPRRSTTNLRGTVVGAALSIGAGAGAVFGLLLGGAAGLANGAGLGAGLGIVAGAVWEETHAPR